MVTGTFAETPWKCMQPLHHYISTYHDVIMTSLPCHTSSIYDRHLGLKMGYFLSVFLSSGALVSGDRGLLVSGRSAMFLGQIFVGLLHSVLPPHYLTVYLTYALCGNAKGRFRKCCDWYIIVSICKSGLLKLVLYLR